MKIRNGFVSNSSSSSFLVPGSEREPISEKEREEQRESDIEKALYWEALENAEYWEKIDQMETEERYRWNYEV